MQIMYDFQALINQRYGGVSRYFYELYANLSGEDDLQISVPVMFSRNYYFNQILKKPDFSAFYKIPKFRGACSLLNVTVSWIDIKRKKYDIIHPTYYDPYVLFVKKKSKLIVTVYDMIHEIYRSNYFANDNKTISNKRRMIEAADAIIAISKNTRDDILRFYPHTDPKKIKVVYLAANYFSELTIRTGIDMKYPRRYILYVGARELYKNYNRFIGAVARILQKDNELNVICAGGGEFTSSENKYLYENKIDSQVFQRNVSDEELRSLYKNAICFVFPSEYEGFGIPVLEAFSQSCPVALSNGGSLPEVGGDAALYFDPLNNEDIYDKVKQLIYNETLRDALIALGAKRLRNFSWQTTAKQTLEVYKRCT